MQADIIIPVWNKPVETRNCLVSLVAHTPDCRLIMVDNGSDRETRVILQETAEFLHERALLLCRGRNDGFVGSVNAGLEVADAPWIAVVKPTSIVTPGWYAPLAHAALQRPDAGILVPQLVLSGSKAGRGDKLHLPVEMEPESFHAILFKREFIASSGLVDAELGEGEWCLGDLYRRAHRYGFTSLLVPDSVVDYVKEPVFGSVTRREAREVNSSRIFESRWGLRRSYCIYIPRDMDIAVISRMLDTILVGARQGDRFIALLHHRHYRKLSAGGQLSCHTSISFVSLPRFSLTDAAPKLWRRIHSENPGIEPVIAADSGIFPGGDSALPFTRLAEQIAQRESEMYGGKTDAE